MTLSQPPCSGVVYNDGLTWMPLTALDIYISIVDTSSRVNLKQTYFHGGPDTIEDAYYIFPIPPDAAVCGFQMRTNDGTCVEGVVKEVNQARKEYKEAVQDKRFASLLEQFEHDIFVLSLGSFFPQTEIEISLSFVMDLSNDDEDDSIRFQLPTFVGHRYGVPETSKLYTLKGTSHKAGLSITLDIQMSGEILHIRSNYALQALPTPMQTNDRSHFVRKQFLRPEQTYLHEAFLLIVQATGLDRPRCFSETWKGTTALSLSLVPRFDFTNMSIPSEYIFLIDHSGSMSWDNKMYQAKEALKILLKSLPEKDAWYNVYQFDYLCDPLWLQSRQVDYATLQEALDFSDNIQERGGTELSNALGMVLSNRRRDLPSSIFVLTDGQVVDHQTCIDAVTEAVGAADPRHPLRVFTLAFGHDASIDLCEAIATAGNGFCSTALEGDQLMQKCTTLLSGMTSNLVRDLRIDWGLGPNATIQQTPFEINLFSRKRLTISALVDIPENRVPNTVSVSGKFPNGSDFDYQVLVQKIQPPVLVNSRLQKLHQRPFLHTLTAHKLILDLERGISIQHIVPIWPGLSPNSRSNVVQQEIISLGVKYHLASSQTAFIAVEAPMEYQSATSSPTSSQTNSGSTTRTPNTKSGSSAQGSASSISSDPLSSPTSPSPQSKRSSLSLSPQSKRSSPSSRTDNLNGAASSHSPAYGSPHRSSPPMPGTFPNSPPTLAYTIETLPASIFEEEIVYFFGGTALPGLFVAPPLPLVRILVRPLRTVSSFFSRRFPKLGNKINQMSGGRAGDIWNKLLPTEPTAEFRAKLAGLTAFQAIDGSFANLRDLCNFVGCTPDIPSHVVFPDPVDKNDIWATAIAIEYLRRRHPQHWLTWKESMRKSMSWGQKACGSLEKFEEIMAQARVII